MLELKTPELLIKQSEIHWRDFGGDNCVSFIGTSVYVNLSNLSVSVGLN